MFHRSALGLAFILFSIFQSGSVLSAESRDTGVSNLEESDSKPMVQMPALLLYQDFANTSNYPFNEKHDTSPRLYIAVWGDGTIIWGERKDCQQESFADLSVSINYYVSKISSRRLKKFFAKIDDLHFWKYSGSQIVPTGVSFCQLYLENNNKYSTMFIWDITWPNHPYSNLYDSGDDFHDLKVKWPVVVRSMRQLVPKKGKKVTLSFSSVELEKHGIIEVPLIVQESPGACSRSLNDAESVGSATVPVQRVSDD